MFPHHHTLYICIYTRGVNQACNSIQTAGDKEGERTTIYSRGRHLHSKGKGERERESFAEFPRVRSILALWASKRERDSLPLYTSLSSITSAIGLTFRTKTNPVSNFKLMGYIFRLFFYFSFFYIIYGETLLFF